MAGNLELKLIKDLISIIVPVYNAEEYIEGCLCSLLEQTYSNIEVICVDDCSTDNSVNIIKKYEAKDNRIKLFSTENNSGPATARNIGLDNSNGEFIMFCDNDDTYCNNMCETMVSAMIDKNADLVTCRANIINRHMDEPLANYINSNPLGFFKIPVELKHSINVLLWNKIYKKTIIEKYGIRFPDGVSAEDDAFIIQYACGVEYYLGLEVGLYNHLFRKSSFTNTIGRAIAKEKKFDKIKIIKCIYDFMDRNNLLEKEELHLKYKIISELAYMFKYNNLLWDKLKIISLYNDFVKSTKKLKYKEYNYYNLYKRLHNRINPIALYNLINKCYWF